MILSLGRKLVRELELEHTCETLSKWLAHYLAEQMVVVETTKSQKQRSSAQKKCCELILKIWEQRHTLPYGAKPLGRIEEALKTLVAMQSQQDGMARFFTSESPPGDNAWFDFAEKTYETEWRLMRISFLTGLIESDFGTEKQWVDEHGDALSEDERKLIDALDSWLNLKSHFFATADDRSVGDLPPAERTNLVLKELDSLSKKQRRAFLDLKKRLSEHTDR